MLASIHVGDQRYGVGPLNAMAAAEAWAATNRQAAVVLKDAQGMIDARAVLDEILSVSTAGRGYRCKHMRWLHTSQGIRKELAKHKLKW